MSDRTAIEWTDASWNPIRGCSRVSEGCRNCYAERQGARLAHVAPFGPEGAGPYAGLVKHTKDGPRWTGEVRLVPELLDRPFRWRAPRRVFVNSMSDLFHEKVPDAWITAIFGVMLCARRHVFQILTKRPARMREYVAAWGQGEDAYMRLHLAFANSPLRAAMGLPGNLAACLLPDRIAWPLPNVWLGTSVEDQPSADARVPELLRTPAAVRFVSYEPALKAVDFRPWLPGFGWPQGSRQALLWVIVGGESGPGARPFDLAWARSVVADCRAAGVPVFVKQLGSRPTTDHRTRPARESFLVTNLRDRKGGAMEEWPNDLRVREWPR